MEKNNIEIVECIMQQKIANFIKGNKNMDKKQLAQKVEQMLNKKEEMYYMNEEELKQELIRMENENGKL